MKLKVAKLLIGALSSGALGTGSYLVYDSLIVRDEKIAMGSGVNSSDLGYYWSPSSSWGL